MKLEAIHAHNREKVNAFIQKQWCSLLMVVRGTVYDMSILNGFFLSDDEALKGLITFEIRKETLEIMSLDSLEENKGIGTTLLNAVIEEAKQQNCKKIKLITTNDNLNAMKFYQKRGFDLVRLYPNGVNEARNLKPSIPLMGEHGIPLRHELEFEMSL